MIAYVGRPQFWRYCDEILQAHCRRGAIVTSVKIWGVGPPGGKCLAKFFFRDIDLKIWESHAPDPWKNMQKKVWRRIPQGSGAQNLFCLFFPGSGAWLPHIFKTISRKKLGKNSTPQGGPTPKIFGRRLHPPLGNVPAKLHPDISKTVACGRWRTSADRKQNKTRWWVRRRGGA